MTLGNKP
ncbi:uncharacterized protein FFC1_15745 [Fusarium fujikuroi]|nr:uncharacterized protein FFC1_15745 [Fusarium fujikuroi]